MNRIYKILLVLSILAILTGVATSVENKTGVIKQESKQGTINGTTINQTADWHIAIEDWPPWDSSSQVQSTNAKNIFMKVDFIPPTDWVDIQGYYDQLNYFQLPITIKLVNGTNMPMKYKDIFIYIDEYETWYEGGWFTCNCWRYNYITTYYKKRNTGSTGYAEYLFSLPYKGYDRTMYSISINYWAPNGDYTYYTKNTKVAWYINTAGAPPTKAQLDKKLN